MWLQNTCMVAWDYIYRYWCEINDSVIKLLYNYVVQYKICPMTISVNNSKISQILVWNWSRQIKVTSKISKLTKLTSDWNLSNFQDLLLLNHWQVLLNIYFSDKDFSNTCSHISKVYLTKIELNKSASYKHIACGIYHLFLVFFCIFQHSFIITCYRRQAFSKLYCCISIKL